MWYSSRERVFIVQIFLKDPVCVCVCILYILFSVYSRIALIQINLEGEPSGYAENPVNVIFIADRVHWQF